VIKGYRLVTFKMSVRRNSSMEIEPITGCMLKAKKCWSSVPKNAGPQYLQGENDSKGVAALSKASCSL
jgi:hypothetical protein